MTWLLLVSVELGALVLALAAVTPCDVEGPQC